MGKALIVFRVAVSSLILVTLLGVIDTRLAVEDHDSASATLFVGVLNKQNELQRTQDIILEAQRDMGTRSFLIMDKVGYASDTAAKAYAEMVNMRRFQHAHPGMPGFPPHEKTTEEPK